MTAEPMDPELQPMSNKASKLSSVPIETPQAINYEKEVESVDSKTPDIQDYPHGVRLAAIAVSLMLGMFLVALDNVSSVSCIKAKH